VNFKEICSGKVALHHAVAGRKAFYLKLEFDLLLSSLLLVTTEHEDSAFGLLSASRSIEFELTHSIVSHDSGSYDEFSESCFVRPNFFVSTIRVSINYFKA
jgi:hypothetical protein